MEKIFLILVLILQTFCLDEREELKFEMQDKQEVLYRGKSRLEAFESRNILPQHSKCWREAISALKSGCPSMNDEGQSFLALRLANCHLSRSGLPTYSCRDGDDFESCTKPMAKDPSAFIVYTEFFTHVKDICYYLQSEVWREKTSQTVSKLSKVSSDVADRLEVALTQQQEVLKGQETSLKNQEEILQHELHLKTRLQDSAENVEKSFTKIREEAKLQKDLYLDTFNGLFRSLEKLTKLQSMLLGEFISLQSVAFYLVAVIVCYLFTSTSRTSGARLPLFLMLTTLIFCERCLSNQVVLSVVDKDSSSEDFHHQIWFLRKIFLLLMTVVYGYVAISYKDFNKINNQMLKDIERSVLEIKNMQLTFSPKANKITRTPLSSESNSKSASQMMANSGKTTQLDTGPEIVSYRTTNIAVANFGHCLDELSDDEDGVGRKKLSTSISCQKIATPKKTSTPQKDILAKRVNVETDKTFSQKKSSTFLEANSGSRYNLRVRNRSSTFMTPPATPKTTRAASSYSNNSTPKKSSKNTKSKTRKKKMDPRPFFSSDEED